MDNNIKLFNFYFPDNSVVEISMEDKPVGITTFLPGQQPLIFNKHKFIYQPITKVACKTIKTWMLSLMNEDLVKEMGESVFARNIEIKHGDNSDFNLHTYSVSSFGSVRHQEESDVNGKLLRFERKYIKVMDNNNFEFADQLKDYFKFTFVRNPWSRVFSAYLEKFKTPGGVHYNQAVALNNSFFKTISDIKPEYVKTYFDDDILSFDGFIDILYQYSKYDYDNFDIHWFPQHMIHDMYIKEYDFIGKLENFENDFDKILETLNIKIKPKYKIGSNSHTVQKHYKFYKDNPKLIDKVAEIYKEDVERYNYDFSDLEK